MQATLNSGEILKAIPTIENFNELGAWGLYSSVDVHNCDPHIIRDAEMIRQYIIQLCDLIEMKRFGEPQIVHFGEDDRVAGYSMTQLIETSLISGHFANQSNTSYIDVFSCKYYDPDVVARFTLSFFKGSDFALNIALRK
ncbi:MAG TPA: S-adenosylmethionine decarboxylase [Spirochaetes bacterium]|nr:S-adenosylmethionine decarboxylase [Spirochaetota bacterium]